MRQSLRLLYKTLKLECILDILYAGVCMCECLSAGPNIQINHTGMLNSHKKLAATILESAVQTLYFKDEH